MRPGMRPGMRQACFIEVISSFKAYLLICRIPGRIGAIIIIPTAAAAIMRHEMCRYAAGRKASQGAAGERL